LELGAVGQDAVDVPVVADLDRLHLSGRDLVLQLRLVVERLDLTAVHAAGPEQQDRQSDGNADPGQPHPPPRRRGWGWGPGALGWRPRLGLVAQVHRVVQALRHRVLLANGQLASSTVAPAAG